MLPEFLFTVGNSMQELPRDDFSPLNGAVHGCDKDICFSMQQNVNASTTTLPPAALNLNNSSSKSLVHVEEYNNFNASSSSLPSLLNGVKHEDSSPIDLFPSHSTTWQQHPMNSHELAHHRLHMQQQQQHAHSHSHPHHHRMSHAGGTNKLLLQSSDDPLICHGANSVAHDDDAPAEFRTLIAAVATNGARHNATHALTVATTTASAVPQLLLQKRPQDGCSPLTKQQIKVKAGLMSAQNQAQQAAAAPPKTRTPKPKKKGALKLRFHHQALPPEYLSHYEATQGQSIARAQAKETAAKESQSAVKVSQTAKLPPAKSTHENVRSWLQKIAEIQRAAQQKDGKTVAQTQTTHDANNNSKASSNASTPATVATLNVDKIRVATPPKPIPTETAIREFPTTSQTITRPTVSLKRVINYADLPYMGEITLDNSKPRRGRKPKKADICHLIYKNYGTIFPGTPKSMLTTTDGATTLKLKPGELNAFEEPLNLCLRDQSVDFYSVSSGEEDETGVSEENNSNYPTPVATPADVATDTLLAANMKMSLNEADELKLPQLKLEPSTSASPAPVVTASAADLLLHPVSVYYHKLLQSGTLLQQHDGCTIALPIETIEKDNQISMKIPIPSGLFLTPKVEKSSRTPTPCNSALDYPEPLSTPSSIKSEHSSATNATSTSCATTSATNGQVAPQKRKRSALFIPPVPAENTTNPATEVSICKFKFTGGAKPTLQEKKMLSVDSDGNYRYYSGTGDKSMRGYEFFPRESVQQSGLLPGVNCTGAFLSANGEKLAPIDIAPPSAGLSNELLHIPESPTATLLLPPVPAQVTSAPCHSTSSSPQTVTSSPFSISPSLQQISSSSHNQKQSTTGTATQRHSGERKKKSRRSMQREKLEKTFKEKGFLIQTQHLESAEGATYCKFRQLKKFTRYLFRNWKDYLPDDVQQANAAAAAAAAAAALNKHQVTANGGESGGHAATSTTIERFLAASSHAFEQGQRVHKETRNPRETSQIQAVATAASKRANVEQVAQNNS